MIAITTFQTRVLASTMRVNVEHIIIVPQLAHSLMPTGCALDQGHTSVCAGADFAHSERHRDRGGCMLVLSVRTSHVKASQSVVTSSLREHMQTRILIVEDERDIAEVTAYNLRKSGYEVTLASNGRSALEYIAQKAPDLVILDVMLPELSGTEVASRIRSNPSTATLPIIMVTAKGEEVDQLVGLTVGADDYIAKPFSVKILQARIEAVLRRTKPVGSVGKVISLGPVSINLESHEATVESDVLKLTLTEFRLLSSLVAAQGKVLSRSVLMSRAMGPGVTVTERTIDVHVSSIRKKLGKYAGLITTVRGVGYRMVSDLTEYLAESEDEAEQEMA
jgi:two-component system phosphate regulon response regulator PhoB